MDGVRTTIIGRPRRLTPQRLAQPAYTLNCEEPDNRGLPATVVPKRSHHCAQLVGSFCNVRLEVCG